MLYQRRLRKDPGSGEAVDDERIRAACLILAGSVLSLVGSFLFFSWETAGD
jgi:hypothetical protein